MNSNREAVDRYQKSEKGIAARRAYELRPDVKEKRVAMAKRRHELRYSKSSEYKKRKAKYMLVYSKTDKFKKACSEYSKTDAGKESNKRYRESVSGLAKREINKNKPEYRYYQYKRDAAKRDHSFNLTFSEFMILWKKPCEYCGDDIETIGIDRVDNNLGYAMGKYSSMLQGVQ